MKFGKLLLASAAVFAMSVLSNAANAVTVSIGYQQGASPITLQASGSNTLVATPTAGFGTFDFNSVSASGSPPNPFGALLSSTALNISSATAGTFNIWITAQDNVSPSGSLTFTSSLTSNLLPPGWTVTMTTYLDTTNALWGTGTTLSSNAFTGPATFIGVNSANTGGGLYSITQLISITATGAGNALSTLSVSAVPGPMVGAGLPGLLVAAAGLLALARRRRKVAV